MSLEVRFSGCELIVFEFGNQSSGLDLMVLGLELIALSLEMG